MGKRRLESPYVVSYKCRARPTLLFPLCVPSHLCGVIIRLRARPQLGRGDRTPQRWEGTQRGGGGNVTQNKCRPRSVVGDDVRRLLPLSAGAARLGRGRLEPPYVVSYKDRARPTSPFPLCVPSHLCGVIIRLRARPQLGRGDRTPQRWEGTQRGGGGNVTQNKCRPRSVVGDDVRRL